ncbi:hypothetical protein CSOJ01_03608 [Colletotrichum sojae]|uniref:Uncharacterized protein n=1 Tax=Colletotrichum sojae TaxID=2175907 RepID=A0A8H6N0W6_9PEZI|nr:hypothetical protein CSOJ01_03608 [Colletotrichum sojae]
MAPTMLSPASPVELFRYVVTYQKYPTTLLICSPRADFTASLRADVKSRMPQGQQLFDPEDPEAAHYAEDDPHMALPLLQQAVARHIRVLYVPTVAHLRANLAVFSPADSLTPAPPNLPPPEKGKPPVLLVYGFLDLHRDSSEWSAQGIGGSAAVLVEAASRTGYRPVLVEPKGAGGHESFGAVLHDDAPVLSGSSRRHEGGWTGRTVEVRRVLGRWFRLQEGRWDIQWPCEEGAV